MVTNGNERGGSVDVKAYIERSDAEIAAENEKSNLIGTILLWAGLPITTFFLIMTLFVYSTYWPGVAAGLVVAGIGEIISLLQKIYVNTKRN